MARARGWRGDSPYSHRPVVGTESQRFSTRLTLLALGVATSATLAQPTQAQSADALAAQLTTLITTDTTAFAVGHKDFTRYTTPGHCLAAAQHAIAVGRRSIAAQEAVDTVRRHPMQDTLPASVAAVAQACAVNFPVGSTPVAELPDLFAVALLARNDTLAQAVLARQLTLAKSPGAQAALLAEAVATDLAAAPARVAAAEALVARLDGLGQSAAVLLSRLAAHLRLEQFGDSTADIARVRHEAAQVLTLARALGTAALPADSVNKTATAVLQTYLALSRLIYIRAPDSLAVFARQLQKDATHFSSLKQYATASLDSVVRQLSPVGNIQVDQPTPGLHADFWFPAPRQAQDTLLPKLGHVSLFVAIGVHCYDSYDSYGPSVLDPIGSGCQRTYDLVRRWHAQYGANLDITAAVVAADKGGTVLSGPETPVEAAKNLAWYIFEYLKLPVNRLAVQIVPTTAPLPEPDGRIIVEKPTQPVEKWRLEDWTNPVTWSVWLSYEGGRELPFPRVYHVEGQGGDATVVLTGRDGQTVYGGGPSPVFEQLLARTLASPVPGAAPTTAAPVAPATSPAAPTAPATPPAAVSPVAHPQPGL